MRRIGKIRISIAAASLALLIAVIFCLSGCGMAADPISIDIAEATVVSEAEEAEEVAEAIEVEEAEEEPEEIEFVEEVTDTTWSEAELDEIYKDQLQEYADYQNGGSIENLDVNGEPFIAGEKNIHYAYKDLAGDGTPELLFMTHDEYMTHSYCLIDAFGFDSSGVKRLVFVNNDFPPHVTYNLLPDGRICEYERIGMMSHRLYLLRPVPGSASMEVEDQVARDGESTFYRMDGETEIQISESVYDAFVLKFLNGDYDRSISWIPILAYGK